MECVEWEFSAPTQAARLREQLQLFHQSTQRYGALSVDELHQRGIIDNSSRRFLRSRRVKFFPFSSTDPQTNVVLLVQISKGEVLVLHKKDLEPDEPQ